MVDDPHIGHLAAATIRQHISLDGVVAHALFADKYRGTLQSFVVDRLAQRLGAFAIAHLKLEPCPDPRQRRVGELHALVHEAVLDQVESFEVLAQRRSRQHAAPDHPAQPTGGRLESPGRAAPILAGDDLATLERGVHAGLHLGGRRDVRLPLKLVAGDLVHEETVGVEAARAERGRLTRLEQNLRRHDLQPGWLARLGPCLGLGRLGQALVVARLAEAVKFLGCLHVDLAIVDGRRGKTAAIQHGMRQNLGLVFARFYYVKRAVCAGAALGCAPLAGRVFEHRQVNFPVGMHWRGVALLDAQLDLPVFLAGDDVDAVQFALLGHDVDRVINEDRCAGGGGDLLRPKLDLLALDHDRVGILRLHVRNL